ncbi:maestro heat-like repeat-containing protein family member 7 [Centrocercus urophasianus]|uniref:maestro heat-like repeat-containing protein family member 7 n=1 Tax=Centrocercus urophasianus TaxID=9002 RepID=UPI001C653E26|nr:maestro heat-like repeat-containing protein family member 7 [Centrocercus urophasianus]
MLGAAGSALMGLGTGALAQQTQQTERSWMERRRPSCPQEAWPEKLMVSQVSRLQWGSDEVCEVQVSFGPGERPSASDMSPQEEDPLSCIHACCTRRPQTESQKLSFLASVRAVCEAEDCGAHYRLCVCPLEVAQCIEALLQEEPAERLDTELRQQAMSAVAAMSSAWPLPEERKSGLLRACLSSVLRLPRHEDAKDLDAALYTETMEALHRLLQGLVGSAGTSVLMELQNILELLLPFTTCQLAAVEERAVACIGRLLAFSNTCSLPKVCSCFMGAVVLRHHCTENQRFPVLGKLAGQLILCCTSTDEGTRDEAMKAVHQLFIFIASQRVWLWKKDPKKPQLRERWQTLFYEHVSQENNASKIFRMFLKYLQYPERVSIFLTAIESMTAPSLHSTELAAHMVDVLAAEARFPPGQVRKIVKTIYGSLPSIEAEPALESLGRALLVLAGKHPREMVSSLLGCSPTCTSVTVTMWREMLSEPSAVEKVLQELLQVLTNHSLRHMSTFTGDRPRVLALAQAARTIPEILQLPLVMKEAEAIFPQLFLALLLQVSFTTELTLQEVEIFWEEHRQHQLTPIRSAVQALKVLLCSVGLQRQMEAIQEQGGWDALLSTVTHLQGVQVVARVMRELPGALRDPIFHQLVELLSTKLCSWEMVAMVFLVEMLEGVDPSEELHRVVSLFNTCLQSQSVGTQQLVLRSILELSKRPDAARKMLGLLPCIMEQLQDADSGARAVALPVLSTLLRLLERGKLSLVALELAGNLPVLFEDESGTVRQLSMHLFLDTLSFVEGREKRKMRKEVYRSLVPLYLHLHDEEESVAKASQKAFLGATRFLRWRRLQRLAEVAQFWQIGECLLVERRKSAAQDYLGQSLLYLQSPQEPLRREAVRFIELVGRHESTTARTRRWWFGRR